MVRAPCCDENGVKKGPWTSEEDKLLLDYIKINGHGSWRLLPKRAGLNRCGKSCRLRWTNYLKPDIKRGPFDEEEEKLIIHFHSILGNKWSSIASKLPGRTDNEIKNYWNTHLRKKLVCNGIDPVTHRPRLDLHNASNFKNLISTSQPNALDLLRLQLVQILLQTLTTTTLSLNPNMDFNLDLMELCKTQQFNTHNPSTSNLSNVGSNYSKNRDKVEAQINGAPTSPFFWDSTDIEVFGNTSDICSLSFHDPFETLENLNFNELS